LGAAEHFPHVHLLGEDIRVWWVTIPLYSNQ